MIIVSARPAAAAIATMRSGPDAIEIWIPLTFRYSRY